MQLALGDHDGYRKLRARLWLLSMTFLTILVTAWFCMMGALAAIIALVVAKHILVALLVMGLGMDEAHAAESAGG